MEKQYRLTERRELVLDVSASPSKPRAERYAIYEFVPIELGAHEPRRESVKR